MKRDKRLQIKQLSKEEETKKKKKKLKSEMTDDI